MAEGSTFSWDKGKLQDIGDTDFKGQPKDPDLETYKKHLPHVFWDSFFEGCGEMKNMYFKLLDKPEKVNCYLLKRQVEWSKHITGTDGTRCKAGMCADRRDWILNQILIEMTQAIDSKDRSLLFPFASWEFLVEQPSDKVYYAWPHVLGMDEFNDKKPHLLAYSTKEKKVMIVEVTVKWEHWLKLPIEEQVFPSIPRIYQKTIDKLKQNGFDVKFKYIEMGCRGVYCQDLYNLFHEDFQMEHDKILEKMKDISIGVLRFSYDTQAKC